MSLLNDTLRDLEQRQKKDGNDELASEYGHLIASSRDNMLSVKTGLIIVSVILTAVLAAAVWYYLPGKVPNKISSGKDISTLNPPSGMPQKIVPVLVAQPDIKVVPSSLHITKIKKVPAHIVKQVIFSAPAIHKVDVAKVATVVVPVKAEETIVKSVKKIRGTLKKIISLSPLQRDVKNVDKARKLLRLGKTKEAQHLLYTFINQHRVNQQSRIILVGLLIQQQKYSEVSALLPSGKTDKSAPLRLLKARWFLSQGRRQAALALLQSDPPSAIDDPDYLALMAVLYQQAGDFRKSVKIYGKLLESFPDKADWWVGLGASLERLPDIKNARRAYQKALMLPGLKIPLRKYAEARLKKLLR